MPDENLPNGCLGFFLQLFGGASSTSPKEDAKQFPYQRRDYLLSKSERLFFDSLNSAVGSSFLVFSKVRLADLIFVKKGTEKRQTFFNRIQSKHIDFVLCSTDQVRPVLAIELDDSSHEREDRQERDDFVDSALAAAGMPILHVKARASYDVQQLRADIKGYLKPPVPKV